MSQTQENPFVTLLVTGDGMGQADATLRHKLIRTYLQLLDDSNTLPNVICFYTEGVKLVTHDSPVLDLLQALERKGVTLTICSTCLNYYGLAEQVAVGVVGGMTDIIEAQWRADKVITI
ncbi:MAG TPA: sulfurtransferase-like selenium metabolism protein YedF [Chloroflexi bacterium]|nr:sulfurtransferase-like selenium metabolism protein YedF [Chloroflexota bacterium]